MLLQRGLRQHIIIRCSHATPRSARVVAAPAEHNRSLYNQGLRKSALTQGYDILRSRCPGVSMMERVGGLVARGGVPRLW